MIKELLQIVPSQTCLACDVCCRYPERQTQLCPCFFDEEISSIGPDRFPAIGKSIDRKPLPLPHKGHFACSFFAPAKNACSIYSFRPFDCRLYPFMVTHDREYSSVILAADSNCPHIIGSLDTKEINGYVDYISGILESDDVVEKINSCKNFINDFQESSVKLRTLEKLSRRVCFYGAGLKRLSLKDKPLFDECFSRAGTALSAYSFASIYVWSPVMNILWKRVEDAICVFAGNDRDYFLLLPPIGPKTHNKALTEALEILSALNCGSAPAARIENIPQAYFGASPAEGLHLEATSEEYVYDTRKLAGLEGILYKSKRGSVNAFARNNKYNVRPLEKKAISECLGLYRDWAGKKIKNDSDDYGRILAEDSYFAQKAALMDFEALGLSGIIVEVNGRIAGYSMGCPLTDDTFAILFETADTGLKGLPQTLFKELCTRLEGYKYINTMADYGLAGLRRSKESYRPVKKTEVFTAYLA